MKESDLKSCPFCGGKLEIGICDDEGNIKDESYVEDAYSGLGYYLKHEISNSPSCPIATHAQEILGTQIYDTKLELADSWNRRVL